jgi:hypothetical protein
MKLRVIVYFIFITFLMITCRNQSAVQDQTDSIEITGFDQYEEVKEVYYRFPSPDEMLGIINNEEINFNDEILLPIENARAFLDSKSQALNLGIYIADLAYIALFQRQKESLIYMQVVYGLSDKLRISSAFNPELIGRFEENIGNPDSLEILIDEAITGITDYLAKQDKERVFAVISIGAFVESLYLAFKLVDDFSEDNVIVQRISDQKLVLENLLNFSLEYSNDKNVTDAIKLLHPIRQVYNELQVSSEETSVTQDEDGKLIIGGGDKIKISEEQFNKLKDATKQTRTTITENLEN